jgi:DNA-binding response OmpR family regulator
MSESTNDPRVLEGNVLTGGAQLRRRVLLVDDDQRILLFVRLKLMASGYDVITAMTGQGAVTMIESQKPDVLVLDLKMPGMGGLEVLRVLRTSSKLPVIIISAATDLAEEAANLGADVYLPKPFSPNELVTRIERILGGHDGHERAVPAESSNREDTSLGPLAL